MITKNGVTKLLQVMHPCQSINLVVKDLKRVENEKVAARLKLSDETPRSEPISAIVPKPVWTKVNTNNIRVCNGSLIEVRANQFSVSEVAGQKIIILSKPFRIIPQVTKG